MADDYQRPYTIMFNGVADALTALDRGDCVLARAILVQAQRKAEEAYISWTEDSE